MKEDVIAANLANLRKALTNWATTHPNKYSRRYLPLMNGLFTTALPKVSATVGTMPCRY